MALGADATTVSVRGGERLRLTSTPVPPETPLRGWVFLTWGSELRLRRLTPGEWLQRLAGHRTTIMTTPAPLGPRGSGGLGAQSPPGMGLTSRQLNDCTSSEGGRDATQAACNRRPVRASGRSRAQTERSAAMSTRSVGMPVPSHVSTNSRTSPLQYGRVKSALVWRARATLGKTCPKSALNAAVRVPHPRVPPRRATALRNLGSISG